MPGYAGGSCFWVVIGKKEESPLRAAPSCLFILTHTNSII